MKERIKHFIDQKGITAGELALMLDVQRSNISHILNGRNKPGAAFIEKLLLKFPEMNARWLLTGEGNMNEGESTTKITDSKSLFDPPPAELKPKETKETILPPALAATMDNEEIDRLILIHNDGTFTTLKPRNSNKDA